MPRIGISLIATLVSAALGSCAAAAQTAANAPTTAGSGPVAYVYVSRPTHVDGFAASTSGRLTPVPGSPFPGIEVQHLSVTKKFLFGAGDDNQTIYSYAIASNGSIKKVGEINTITYEPADNSCFSVGPTQVDFARQTLYNDDWNCDGDSQYIQSYHIESNGELTFLENSGGESEDYAMGPPVLVGTDQYLYVVGAYGQGETGGLIQGYKRQSNGAAELTLGQINLPQPSNPDDDYTPTPIIASDPTNHLALTLEATNAATGYQDGPPLLASFTANPDGTVTTTNTQAEMPTSDVAGCVSSISPTGKLLAVAAGGWCTQSPGMQIFHFNGANPITKYSGVMLPNTVIQQFGWDKSNHLYALGGGNLHVYTVTPTSIKEAPGSPYSIPESSSVIVLDLQ